MIIAFQNFQDYEYAKSREILETQGVKITVAGSKKGEATGKFGTKVRVDLFLNEAKTKDFDVIIFIGGPGAIEYQENTEVHRLAQEAIAQGKVLAAICIAPTILSRAGVLQGKKATVWSSPMNKDPIQQLQQAGAIFIDQDVVQDDKIVTANGPQAAEKFSQTILKILKGGSV